MANSWGGDDIVIAGAQKVPGYEPRPRRSFDKPMLKPAVKPNRQQRRSAMKRKKK